MTGARRDDNPTAYVQTNLRMVELSNIQLSNYDSSYNNSMPLQLSASFENATPLGCNRSREAPKEKQTQLNQWKFQHKTLSKQIVEQVKSYHIREGPREIEAAMGLIKSSSIFGDKLGSQIIPNLY